MKILTKEECINFIPAYIDYEEPIVIERHKSYTLLLIYLLLRDNPEFARYKTYCELYGIEDITSEEEFIKWHTEYKKALAEKINGFCKRWNTEKEFIMNKLLEDEYFAYMFIKEPGRKTFHQHLAANFIKNEIPFIYDFYEPPNHGDDALFVENGNIKRSCEMVNTSESKSIDFCWKYSFKNKELLFYATHKHTDDSGGAQDNQFKDVCDFLNQATECTDTNVVLLSITDGKYYQKKYTKYKIKSLTAIEYLKEFYKSPRVLSTTTNELLKDIIPFIVEWLKTNFSEEEISSELDKIQIIQMKI